MNLRFLFYLIISSLFSLPALSQSESPKIREGVIEFSGLDSEKRLDQLQQHLQLNGNFVQPVSYCKEKGWLLVLISEEQIADDDQLALILRPLGLSFLIKSGAGRKEFMAACTYNMINF